MFFQNTFIDLAVHAFSSDDGRHFSTPEHADFVDNKITIRHANELTAQRKEKTGFSIPNPPRSWKTRGTTGI